MDYLSLQEAADYLKVSKSTINRWANPRGLALPYTKLGGRKRFDEAELLDFVKSHAQNQPGVTS